MGNDEIIHDAEYYLLYEQNKDSWDREDKEIESKLEECRKKTGTKPNILHIM